MIGKAVKNYFVNLKYFFTPLGTLALGLILGLSVLIPGAKAALEILVSSVQTTLKSAEIDVEHLEQSLVAAVRALDWSDPFGSIATMFGEEWLTDTLNNSILPFVENAEIYAEELLLSIEAFTLSLVALIIIAAVLVAIGFVAGFLLIKLFIRRDIAKRSFLKFLLMTLLDALLAGGMIALCTWIYSLSPYLLIAAIVIGLVLSGGISLLEAYLVHGRKKVAFKTVVNVKNVFRLYVGDLLVLLISVAFSALVSAAINVVAGALLGLIFVEIALIVVDLNAESYVNSLTPETTRMTMTHGE